MVFYKNFIYFLILILIAIWLAVFSVDNNLHIIACNVGQGDAILIQKITTQILIDSGPNNKVLDCLGKYMPFWDKTIELVILTHPDKDHSGGMVDVIKRYKITKFLTNDLNNELFSSSYVEVLRTSLGSVIHPEDGMIIRIGMIYLDILHPDGKFETLNPKSETSKTNNYSIVTLLKYDQFKALFTGDIEDYVSDLIATRPQVGEVNYIKVPHHGSKNGLSESLLEVLRPSIAVISLGKNSYGHPHEEVLDLLEIYNVKVLRTDEMGDVKLVTDGRKYWSNN